MLNVVLREAAFAANKPDATTQPQASKPTRAGSAGRFFFKSAGTIICHGILLGGFGLTQLPPRVAPDVASLLQSISQVPWIDPPRTNCVWVERAIALTPQMTPQGFRYRKATLVTCFL